MTETMKFTLEFTEVVVELTDPKDGVTKKHTLREFTGKQRDQYLNKLKGRMKVGPSGTGSINSFDDYQADLLSRCLFDENEENVKIEVIREFPAHIQAALFTKAQDICGLGDDTEDASKNASEENDTDGSN